jgi:hypothetical protein
MAGRELAVRLAVNGRIVELHLATPGVLDNAARTCAATIVAGRAIEFNVPATERAVRPRLKQGE